MVTLKSSLRKVVIRTTIFLTYLFLGAGMFFGLEGQPSVDRFNLHSSEYEQIRSDYLQRFNMSLTKWNELESTIYEAWRNGVIGNSYTAQWTFGNSFFFCGNVITTIGYGSIVPKTDFGKILMFFYALFGIPLTGFFLRTVGNELTNLIAFLIKTYERRTFNREAEKLEVKCAVVATFLALFMLCFGAILFHSTENAWGFLDGFYFCFVTITTIGFGDLVPFQDENYTSAQKLGIEMAVLVYYVLGLSIMSGVIVSISGVIEEKTKKLDITDPMDAIRNLRIENLNSKAMKKLGYKVEEDPLPNSRLPQHIRQEQLAKRRGTIVPEDDALRRNSRNQHENGTAQKLSKLFKEQIEGRSSLTNGKLSSTVQNKRDITVKVDLSPKLKQRLSPTKEMSTPEEDNQEQTIEDELHQNVDENKSYKQQKTKVSSFPNNTEHDNDENVLDRSLTSLNSQDSHEIYEEIYNGPSNVPMKVRVVSVTEKEESTNKTNNNNNNRINHHQGFHIASPRSTHDSTYLIPNNEHFDKKKTGKHIEDISSSSKSQNLHPFLDVKHSKRVGLPAALFANRLSMTLNTIDDNQLKALRDGFSRIPASSPVPSEYGFFNAGFHMSDENRPSSALSTSSSLELRFSERFTKKRRSSTGCVTNC